MCVCASEETRPRLFNCLSIVLVTIWVLIVSVVAHTVEVQPVAGEQTVQAFVEHLIN